MDHSNGTFSPAPVPWPAAFAGVVKREFFAWFKNPTFVVLVWIVPLTLSFFICYIYTRQVVRDLPVAVCDMDHSPLSRQLAQAIDASSAMAVVAQVTSTVEMERGLRDGRLCAGFYFPLGMESDIKRGHSARPVMYKNSQNIMTGATLYKETQSIMRTFNAGIVLKRLMLKGVPRAQAMACVNPLAADGLVLFNPTFSYLQFLCPGIIFAQLQAIIVLAALLAFAGEFEHKTMSHSLRSAGNRPVVVLLGKAAAYTVVFIGMCMAITYGLFPLFTIVCKASLPRVAGMVALYVAACVGPGVLLGLLIKNQMAGITAGIVINMPAFIFGGFTFPLWAMPGPIVAVAHALPFTYFSTLFFKTCLMSAPMRYCTHEIVALALFASVSFAAAIPLFIRQARNISRAQGPV